MKRTLKISGANDYLTGFLEEIKQGSDRRWDKHFGGGVVSHEREVLAICDITRGRFSELCVLTHNVWNVEEV